MGDWGEGVALRAKYHAVFGVIDDVARLGCTGEPGEGWGYSGVTEVGL